MAQTETEQIVTVLPWLFMWNHNINEHTRTHILPGTQSGVIWMKWLYFPTSVRGKCYLQQSKTNLGQNKWRTWPIQTPKTSDPFMSFFWHLDNRDTVNPRDNHFHVNKRRRRVASALNEHWNIMSCSRSINDLWKWLIISVLTLLTPSSKVLRQCSPLSNPEGTRRDVVASFRHERLAGSRTDISLISQLRS